MVVRMGEGLESEISWISSLELDLDLDFDFDLDLDFDFDLELDFDSLATFSTKPISPTDIELSSLLTILRLAILSTQGTGAAHIHSVGVCFKIMQSFKWVRCMPLQLV
jgi:hypothetical protein